MKITSPIRGIGLPAANRKDYAGHICGCWIPESFAGSNGVGGYWFCRCECGAVGLLSVAQIRSYKKKQPTCKHRRKQCSES